MLAEGLQAGKHTQSLSLEMSECSSPLKLLQKFVASYELIKHFKMDISWPQKFIN